MITKSLDRCKRRFAICSEAYEIEGYDQAARQIVDPILASNFHHGYSEKKKS
jgi:hypothetical protein